MRTCPVTPGKTQSTQTSHQPTHPCRGTSTPHLETTATSCDIAAMPTQQACGQTVTYSNAAVHWHLVCHRATDEPHHILTPGHPTFDGWNTIVLEDWFIDIKTAADILKESHAHLAEAKSCGLTHTLVCKAFKTGKCWDDIRDILHLKLCNINIHTYTLHFIEIR